MHKLFRLAVTVAVIVICVPLEVLCDGKLQGIADILENMNTTRLCDHDCVPVVDICGTNVTVSFEANISDTDDTDALCKCMYDYMKDATGNATSECKVTATQLAIVFRGQYDPNKKPLPPLTTLTHVLSDYEKPDLGGYECTKEISKNDGRIYIRMTYIGKKYETACDGILKYLNQNNFLHGSTNRCTKSAKFERAVLDVWANK